MTAAHVLGVPRGIDPATARALLLYLDIVNVDLDADEAAAICAESRKLIAGMTPDQALRLRLIVHALHGPNKWTH